VGAVGVFHMYVAALSSEELIKRYPTVLLEKLGVPRVIKKFSAF